jgi:replicative DNA helicase
MSDKQIRFEPLVGKALDRIGARITESVPSIATPFPSWNVLCGEEGGREGIAHTWMVVIGGADGVGKSYLAVNVAAHAVSEGYKVGFINFEMTESGLTQRYLSVLSGVPKYRLEHGEWFSQKAWNYARSIADEHYNTSGACIVTNSTSIFDLDDISAAYARLADEGCTMIVIDYAQLVRTGDAGIFARSEAVSHAVRGLSHEHKVVTVILSQLNREGKKAAEQPPSRHHLMGGTWENDANQIIVINHTLMVYNRDEHEKYTEIILDKNRHGDDKVVIPITIDLRSMRWREGGLPTADGDSKIEIAPVEPDDEPDKDRYTQGFMEV